MKIDNAQLSLAAETYQKYFKECDLQIFDISSLDRIGIPIYLAVLRNASGFLNNGIGYGSNASEALVGALGELSETFHVYQALKVAQCCESVNHYDMVNHFGYDQVIDPLSLCLSAGYPYHDKLPLRWVAVQRLSDGATCWAPRESVAFSGFSYKLMSSDVVLQSTQKSAKLFPPITCGLGAGLTKEQALSHGTLELLQRDGNCTSFRALDKGIDIELDVIESEEIKNTLLHLKNIGFHVRVKLASTDFGLVNLYVFAEPADKNVLNETFPILATACGEAVHPNRERALSKALHEFISSRSRKAFMHGPIDKIKAFVPNDYLENILSQAQPLLEESKAITEMAEWLLKSEKQITKQLSQTVFSSHKTVMFSSLQSISDEKVINPIARLKDVTERLQTQNIPLYYFDGSPRNEDGPKIVKVFAPGLEGETLSYWRIGKRGAKRLLESQSTLVSQNPPDAQHLLINMLASDQDAMGGPTYFKVPEWEKILKNHYPLYREPSPHTVQKYIADNEF